MTYLHPLAYSLNTYYTCVLLTQPVNSTCSNCLRPQQLHVIHLVSEIRHLSLHLAAHRPCDVVLQVPGDMQFTVRAHIHPDADVPLLDELRRVFYAVCHLQVTSAQPRPVVSCRTRYYQSFSHPSRPFSLELMTPIANSLLQQQFLHLQALLVVAFQLPQLRHGLGDQPGELVVLTSSLRGSRCSTSSI